ncbi:ABC transporter permease [Robertmurraya sp. Marseille-Q9965]
MNFLKRSWLSVKARKGKSLLQIIVFSAIFVLVLAGLSIQSAADKSSDLARQKLGADVTLQQDMDKMREKMQEQLATSGEGGGRMRIERTPIDVTAAKELTTYDQIKGYNFYSSTTGIASDFEPIENESSTDNAEEEGPGGMIRGGMALGDVTIQGVAFTDSETDFMEGNAAIVKGRHLTSDDLDKNVAVIEQTLAENNDLSVGDSITVANPSDEKTSSTLEIVGIYSTTSTGSDMGMNLTAMNPYNKIYVPYTAASTLKGADYVETIDSAIYYIDDPADMESFVEQAKKESSIDFDTFTLNSNDQLYQQMVGPIENVASFSKNVVYLVSIAGAVILGLIVMMSIRERKYEMGVLLAIGEKRWKLIGQFTAEILLVAVLSLGIATVSGNYVADQMGQQLLDQEVTSSQSSNIPESFGGRGGMLGGQMGARMGGMNTMQSQQAVIDELSVQVTGNDLGMLALIGAFIAIFSALVPSLSVLRLQPKVILTKQD